MHQHCLKFTIVLRPRENLGKRLENRVGSGIDPGCLDPITMVLTAGRVELLPADQSYFLVSLS